MGITFNESSKIFKLDTKNTSYVMGVEDSFGYLLHYYYGKKLRHDDVNYLGRTGEAPLHRTEITVIN